MKSRLQPSQQGNFLLPELRSQLDPRQGLYKLAERIDWEVYEEAFGSLYSEEGRPALPIRRMVGLLLLKYLHNLSEERVVEFWSLSPYAQYFCGEEQMQWGPPCEASELTHFRKRIGPGGAEKIFSNLSPSRLGSLLGLIHRN
ncbi:MAG: transposase [Chthoniobacterales bacterium]